MAGDNGGNPWTGMGALVRRYREDKRVTQRELAAAAGMSVGALRDLEQGRTRSPRWGSVEGLAAVLGLSPAQRAELAGACRAAAAGPRSRRDRAGRSPGVRVSVLGPLAAWRDGIPLALGSARQRAVLGVLALHADASVHRDAIIDLLWGQRPPPTAVSKVQGYVSWLRKILGARAGHTPSADLVITTVGGCCYCLHAASGHLDLAAFGELTRQAREAGPRHDPAQVCDQYEQALSLWNGDVLADIGLLRDHPATVAVTSRRAEAVLGYAQAAIQAGAHTRVLPHLRDLCARESLNEHAHACLMTTLAATGQQAAALEVFAGMRRRLDDELGITPSTVLAQAHAQVLRQQLG